MYLPTYVGAYICIRLQSINVHKTDQITKKEIKDNETEDTINLLNQALKSISLYRFERSYMYRYKPIYCNTRHDESITYIDIASNN
jgi:hypothetical protein